MRIPERLVSLADQGIIDEVVRPLMSGKEAEVFLIASGGQLRVAKVYKDAQNRTFKNRAEYTEGRKVRNSRDQRAIDKRSRHGRAQDEAAWRSTEVDMIYRLRDAGVRVPTPYHFIDGVLIMEMVADADGNPAPRLGELRFSPVEATQIFDQLLTEVVRMLCAGVVHGDLSDFNVLMGADGPVVIDFPQAVDASSNQNARKLLLRDVANLQRFLSKFVPNQPPRPHAQEMWELYSRSLLTPETRLRGQYRAPERRVDTAAVLELIGDANHDERRRREAKGLSMRGVAPAPRPDDRSFNPPRQDNRSFDQPRQESQPRQDNRGFNQPRQENPPRQENQPRQDNRGFNQPRQENQPRQDDRSFNQPRQENPPRQDNRGFNQPRQENPPRQDDRSFNQPRHAPNSQQRQGPAGNGAQPHGAQPSEAHPSTMVEAPGRPATTGDGPRPRRVEVVVVPSGSRGRPRPQQGPPAAGPPDAHRRRAVR